MAKRDSTRSVVMAGHSRSKNGVASARLCPAIHALAAAKKDVDGRDRSGNDVERVGLKDLHESCWNCKGKATGGGFAPGAASGVVRPPSPGAAVAAAKG